MCLCHHILHYRAIRDACPGASRICIHWRCASLEHVSHYGTHPRRASNVRITDLIVGWGPYGTNTRRARGSASLITKESETHLILARCQFNYRLGPLWH
jgi:hypothetical protein